MAKKKILTPQSFLSSRGMTKIFMAVALIGFSLPFFVISCGTKDIVTFSGYDLIFGKEVFYIDRLVNHASEPLVIFSLISAIVVFVAAFFVYNKESLIVWVIASAAGLASLVYYLFTLSEKEMAVIQRVVEYDTAGQLSTVPQNGLYLTIIMFFCSFIMFVRKMFFEAPDPKRAVIDESDVYEAIVKEAKTEKPPEKPKNDEDVNP
ncbi:MAG: hypothetical protein LBL34_05065 [Clostridiales bacterium]|nr:hypothetical protein [Clostridiales bacterium]